MIYCYFYCRIKYCPLERNRLLKLNEVIPQTNDYSKKFSEESHFKSLDPCSVVLDDIKE